MEDHTHLVAKALAHLDRAILVAQAVVLAHWVVVVAGPELQVHRLVQVGMAAMAMLGSMELITRVAEVQHIAAKAAKVVVAVAEMPLNINLEMSIQVAVVAQEVVILTVVHPVVQAAQVW